jgi:AraC-like DNA-binding protein/mannose-6-phosphate isomerase-like protein (cupin superfamily)
MPKSEARSRKNRDLNLWPVLRSREYLQAGFPLYIDELEQKAIHSHAHEFFEMVYVRRGRGTHVIGNQNFAIRAGDLFIIHPQEPHQFEPEPGTTLRIFNVLWEPKLVRQLLRARDTMLSSASLPYIEPLLKPGTKFLHRLHLSGSDAFRVEVLLDEMHREIESALEGKAAPGCHVLLRHLFCSFLILLSRAQEKTSRRSTPAKSSTQRASQQDTIARAVSYLEDKMCQAVRVEEVAAHVALSPSRLSHLFKAHTGRSVIRYLHELRLEQANQLLLESTLPAHTVASECGFGDARFFHRVFRRHFGCSPQQWRAAQRL